jgi:hypothetical protein
MVNGPLPAARVRDDLAMVLACFCCAMGSIAAGFVDDSSFSQTPVVRIFRKFALD